jgi:parallel beta-helix repeat protein
VTRVLLAVTLLAAGPAAAAGPYAVNTATDGHDADLSDGVCQTSTPAQCTLRAAVEQAKHDVDAIVNVPAGTYNLSLGALDVQNVHVNGAGMKKTIVSAKNLSRVATLTSGYAYLQDLTLRDGLNGVVYASGAGLFLTRCLVTSSNGAGIQCDSCTRADIASSEITDCHSTGNGGGISITGASGVAPAIRNCTVANNTSLGNGGGIYLSVSGSPENMRPHAPFIQNTISGNAAHSSGGGAYLLASEITIDSCTIYGNSSDTYHAGGGLAVTGTKTLKNSIVAGNEEAFGDLLYPGDCAGGFTGAGGSNLLSYLPAGGVCSVSGTVHLTDTPGLDGLRDNGGPTPTHALLGTSVALDAGADCSETTDQRGSARIIYIACDLGAYERAPCGDVNGDGVRDIADVFYLINHLFAGGALPPGLSDVNADTVVDVSDVFALVNALFAGGQVTCPGT